MSIEALEFEQRKATLNLLSADHDRHIVGGAWLDLYRALFVGRRESNA